MFLQIKSESDLSSHLSSFHYYWVPSTSGYIKVTGSVMKLDRQESVYPGTVDGAWSNSQESLKVRHCVTPGLAWDHCPWTALRNPF